MRRREFLSLLGIGPFAVGGIEPRIIHARPDLAPPLEPFEVKPVPKPKPIVVNFCSTGTHAETCCQQDYCEGETEA